MSSPQPQTDQNNTYFMFQQILERITRLETKLDAQDEHFYRKDYIDARLAPLEESQLTKNQRLGVYISAALGIASTLINLFSHIQLR